MNLRDPAQIASLLQRAPYAAALEGAFPGALADPARAVDALGAALESFLTAPSMAPFSSKYDDFVRGTAALSQSEKKGLEVFQDPRRGGCAACHKVAKGPSTSARSMFTDYGYEAVGAPRNTRLQVRDEDRGLCERTDATNPSNGEEWCASFRTPSLRNVSLRKSFMHNGVFTRLRDVVKFYATRSSSPLRWYPSGASFDDTPARYRGLINIVSVPYNRRPGDAPALDDAEIDALVAFLGTLTDRGL
jgi:cytochrome c peroxidase